MRRHLSPTLSLVVALVAITTPLGAASVRQFNLAEITQRAAKIYVGTVRTATEGMVEIGGGRLAVVTYRLSIRKICSARRRKSRACASPSSACSASRGH